MGHDKYAEEISDLSEQLQLKRIHEISGCSEEKRMRAGDFAEYDELLNELADELHIARHPNSLVLLQAARSLIRDHCLSSSSISSQGTREQLEHKSLDVTVESEQRQAQSESAKRRREVAGSGVRVQRAKFALDDIILPKSLLKSATIDLVKQESDLERQQVLATESTICMTHETRSRESMTTSAKDESLVGLERAAKALKLLYLDDQRQLQNQVNELISRIQSLTANPKTDPRLIASGR